MCSSSRSAGSTTQNWGGAGASTLLTGIGELFGHPGVTTLLLVGTRIAEIGPSARTITDQIVDVGGRAVLPGFVDSHAHLVFAGDRTAEFAARMSGRPYAAGGIRTTVAATRAASDAQLRATVARLADELLRAGVTTFECKSGYGLDVETERRSLAVAREFTDETTFLGAHVVPTDDLGSPEAAARHRDQRSSDRSVEDGRASSDPAPEGDQAGEGSRAVGGRTPSDQAIGGPARGDRAVERDRASSDRAAKGDQAVERDRASSHRAAKGDQAVERDRASSHRAAKGDQAVERDRASSDRAAEGTRAPRDRATGDRATGDRSNGDGRNVAGRRRADAYVELVAGPMLDACAPLARWIDVFCERGAFDADQARTILRAGQARGLGARVHANQLGEGPGVQLAVELDAASADHCTHLTPADVDALAGSNTVATLLPLAEFSTRSPYPDARRLLDAGVHRGPGDRLQPGLGLLHIHAAGDRAGRPGDADDARPRRCGRPPPAASRALRREPTSAASRSGARADLARPRRAQLRPPGLPPGRAAHQPGLAGRRPDLT